VEFHGFIFTGWFTLATASPETGKMPPGSNFLPSPRSPGGLDFEQSNKLGKENCCLDEFRAEHSTYVGELYGLPHQRQARSGGKLPNDREHRVRNKMPLAAMFILPLLLSLDNLL
jgi:hypothetical protein